jgi:hypothetical protein
MRHAGLEIVLLKSPSSISLCICRRPFVSAERLKVNAKKLCRLEDRRPLFYFTSPACRLENHRQILRLIAGFLLISATFSGKQRLFSGQPYKPPYVNIFSWAP